MYIDQPVINFESHDLKSKISHEINHALNENMLRDMEKAPYTYSAVYEEFLKNLYLTLIHSMIGDADLVVNQIKFVTVDQPLFEPIILVEDESSQLLHVLSRSMFQKIFYSRGNFTIIHNDNQLRDLHSNELEPSSIMMLTLKNFDVELNDEAIRVSNAVTMKLLTCYVVAEHAVMHYCLYLKNRDTKNPDYGHNNLKNLSSRSHNYLFLYKLISTKKDDNVDQYVRR
uniref:PmV-like protein n=1 Tax=Chelonus inanitus TaxID=49201 RepID=B9W4C1_9HYME|nr:PmV-like protein [Chelonus inanitus]